MAFRPVSMRPVFVLPVLAIVFALTALTPASAPLAQQAAPGEAWRSSPFHGVPNAATGNKIPCVCVYRGRDYRLGELICMNTHVGTVIARCDLNLNNTTWAPTEEPCTVSRATTSTQFACFAPAAHSSHPAG